MRAVCTDNRAFLGIKMYSNGTQDVHVCNYAIDKVVRPMLQRHLPFGPGHPRATEPSMLSHVLCHAYAPLTPA